MFTNELLNEFFENKMIVYEEVVGEKITYKKKCQMAEKFIHKLIWFCGAYDLDTEEVLNNIELVSELDECIEYCLGKGFEHIYSEDVTQKVLDKYF